MSNINWQIIEIVLAFLILIIVFIPIVVIRQGEKDGFIE